MLRLSIFIAAGFLWATLGCGNSTNAAAEKAMPITTTENKDTTEIKAGSICTVDNGDSTFGVVKVLVINEEEAHLKIYKNKYKLRPDQVDLKSLSLGSINDTDGFGIGHVPLQRAGFDNWKPVLVGFEPVEAAELEGYLMWKNQ